MFVYRQRALDMAPIYEATLSQNRSGMAQVVKKITQFYLPTTRLAWVAGKTACK